VNIFDVNPFLTSDLFTANHFTYEANDRGTGGVIVRSF
jgi:hypothetical protein